MQNKAILFGSILWVSSSVLADQSLLGSIAEQAAKDTAAVVAPETVKQVETANQALESAKSLKAGVVNAPEVLKDQATTAVKDSVKAVVPVDAVKALGVVNKGKATVNTLKKKVANAPKAIEKQAKQKAVESAVDLLR